MRMAKATPEDLKSIRDFFHYYEYILEHGEINEETIIADWEEDEEERDHLMHFVIKKEDKWARGSTGDFDYVAFFEYWLRRLNTKWRRVVWGCEMLVDNCCDPQESHLAFSPYLEEFHVAPEQ